MNKKIKTVFMLTVIVMIFVIAISLIYGIVNVKKSSLSEESKNNYETIINDCVEKCTSYSTSLTNEKDIESYNKTIEYYKENIDKAKSLQEKAYLSGCMATYSLNFFSQKNIEFQAYVSSNGAASPYRDIIDELNNLITQAENLI
ncbi:MAG: hypothetical protein ACI4VF_05965 [Lachnospirales bacterium]